MEQAITTTVIGGLFTLAGVWLTHYLQNRPKITQLEQTIDKGPVVPAPSTPLTSMNIGAVIRDVGIILLLTAAGGFVIGVASGQARLDDILTAVGLANIIFGAIGFTISGARAGSRRWTHLVAVAIGFWLASGIINVLLLGLPIELWFLGVAAVLLMMVVGGTLSYLFNRK